MGMQALLITGIAFCAAVFLWRVLPWRKIRYRGTPLFVFVVDVILWPFMKIGAEGKITHWWDWTPVPRSEIDTEIAPLVVESKTPQQRVYKITKWLGQYNWEGARDLYKTLFVLQVVVVLEPDEYQGFWRLLISGNRYQDKMQYEIYDRVDVLVQGKVKTLLDGKKYFLGQTEGGIYLALKLVATTTRDQYPDIPFV